MQDPLDYLEIEQNIKGDSSGDYLKEILGRMDDFELHQKRKINNGVTPDEFKRLNASVQAVQEARQIAKRVWQFVHT